MNLVVAGDTEFKDYLLFRETLSRFLLYRNYNQITILTLSEKSGPCRMVQTWCSTRTVSQYKVFHPDKEMYKDDASIMRYSQIAWEADRAILFWNKVFRPTRYLIETLEEEKVDCKVIYY